MSELNEIENLQNQVKKYEGTILYLYEKIKNKHICVLQNCESDNVHLVYCSSCASVPLCRYHLRYIQTTKLCPVCSRPLLKRRWAMPAPQIL